MVETNVIGVVRVTNAMLPLLRRSASPRIVNMSSGVGSLTRQSRFGEDTGPIAVAYSPSKTFLNAVTVQYAKELRDTNILVNLACPGYVATDLNGFRGLPDAGAGRRNRPPARDPARRRPDGRLLRGRGSHPLVSQTSASGTSSRSNRREPGWGTAREGVLSGEPGPRSGPGPSQRRRRGTPPGPRGEDLLVGVPGGVVGEHEATYARLGGDAGGVGGGQVGVPLGQVGSLRR